MSLASQVSAAMTRIGTEFKSVRTALTSKADLSSGLLVNSQFPERLATNGLGSGSAYNTTILSGWYLMDQYATNAPVAANCYLEVRAVFAQNVIEQVARVAVANTGAVVGDAYQRYMIAGVWGAWTKMVKPPTVSTSTGNLAYNSFTDSGWYVMDSAATNAPVAATCYLEVRNYAGTYIKQVATTVTTGLQYTRYMTAGTWGAWVRSDGGWVAFTANVPNVPQSNIWSKYRVQGNFVHVRSFVQLTGAIGTNLIDVPVPFASDAVVSSSAAIGTCRAWRTSNGAFYQGAICAQSITGTHRASVYDFLATGVQWSAAFPVTWASGDRWMLDYSYERA